VILILSSVVVVVVAVVRWGSEYLMGFACVYVLGIVCGWFERFLEIDSG
jgi:hypothetical protein